MGSSLLVSNSKTDEHFPITTSKRKVLFISYFDFVVVCRSLLRLLLEKPSPSRLSLPTPLKMSRLRSKTRKEFPQISNVLSLLENNWKMVALSQTTTSKRSQHFILYSV